LFLKSLTIKGFKSFAETATLRFEPGVTVVVGPNGSGKSNVVDAISWVLGAQAPSSVRSQKMDDVIFAGTTKRSALGRAEVALTIDNSAQLLPIEFSEVTITRTLFRSGDSEYSINSVPCRLLDVQELLSDSGVGRQQHVVVSQGQIDAVLNTRPEDRRAIIEEAAGVLKHRKRREKSQRQLDSTEANLTRLSDLVREVRRQLRPLEKQAEAARRYDGVVSELHALRLFVTGRELVSLRGRLDTVAGRKRELNERIAKTRAELATFDTEVMATEARLGAHGGDDIGDALVRFEALRERVRGLANVLTERQRVIERDRNAGVDRDVLANLEAESARLHDEIETVEHDAELLMPEAEELAAAERELADARARFEQDWADGVLPPSGKASEVRGELGALRTALERARGEQARLQQRRGTLDSDLGSLAGEAGLLRTRLAEVEAAEAPLLEAVAACEATRDSAEAELTLTQASHSETESEWRSWSARADALALALDEARARAGAKRLASVSGVVGTLLDLVEVDAGWEAAFEAAAGEALNAVVVDSIDAGRRAIDALRAGNVSGAVLALGAAGVSARSITPDAVSGAGSGAQSNGTVEPVRGHVRSRAAGVDSLLDLLLAHAVAVEGDVLDAVEIALRDPGAIVVTRGGDRAAASGWRVGGTKSQATGAALEEARARATEADARRKEARGRFDEAREASTAAVRAATKALDEHDKALSSSADALRRIESRRDTLEAEVQSLDSRLGEMSERVTRDHERVIELEFVLPDLEAEEDAVQARGRSMADARARLEERAGAVGALRSDIEVRGAGLDQRRQFLQRRRAEVEQRLERHAAERAEAESRRVELDRRQAATTRLVTVVADRLVIIERELADLRERRRRQSEAARAVSAELDALRKLRQRAEQQLAEGRELANRAELEEAEVTMRIEAVVETIRREFDVEPDIAVVAECPPLDERVVPAARIRDLERDLKLMGPINPLAVEEFAALTERHDFLEQQLEDIRGSRRELAKVIKLIDDEIVNVFAAAYADVSQNFEILFDRLFPGGKGGLRLTEPDDLLNTGIEVDARPSGKNVKKLSLLSGGERSLTALAFLFAVFRSRPSPFYVMDEVEAALDDVNLHRFLGLIEDFRDEAQLIVVSHQKRTMEAADCLYGVTMQPGGSSKVVSEKLRA
jgi:chromosome segregation protein